MRGAVALRAARPTASALPWTPVVVAGAAAVGIAALVDGLSDRPAGLATVGCAAVASGAVAALHDPADRLLSPVPTSRLARRLLRLLLVVGVVVPVVAILGEVSPASEDPWATTLAFVLTGLAVATWLPPGRYVVLAPAVPLTLAFAARLLGDQHPLAGPLGWWADHPLLVAGAAAALIAGGRNR